MLSRVARGGKTGGAEGEGASERTERRRGRWHIKHARTADNRRNQQSEGGEGGNRWGGRETLLDLQRWFEESIEGCEEHVSCVGGGHTQVTTSGARATRTEWRAYFIWSW